MAPHEIILPSPSFLPAALKTPAENLFWGVLVSTLLFGITIVQGWLYLHNNSDKWPLRALVAFLIVVDFTTVISNAELLHVVLLSGYADPNKLLHTPPFANAETMLTVVANFLIQLFFAYRVYILSHSRPATIIIAVTALFSTVAGLVLAVDSTTHEDVSNFSSLHMKLEVGLFAGFSVISDVTTTAVLTRVLSRSDTGVRRTRAVLHRLIMIIVTRGFLVTAAQMTHMVTYLVNPQSLNWISVQLCLARIYVITMVAMLNSRNDLNERINKTTTGDGVNLEFNVGDTTETSTTSPIKSTHSKPTDSRHAIQLETMNDPEATKFSVSRESLKK